MKLDEAFAQSTERLRRAGIAEPHRDAALLIQYAIGRDKTFLIAHPDHELSPAESLTLDIAVERRSRREPLQYVIGRQEFYGIEFFVDRSVLIPRPETEILVEAALTELSSIEDPTFCEIGVGSGCISIAILVNDLRARAVATDISPDAVSVARRNAENHIVADRLKLIEGDLFEGVEGVFDIVVSNPPYVPTRDSATLQAEVKEHEPAVALFGGVDGLGIIERIVHESTEHLKPGGVLLMEIGWDQADRVSMLLNERVWDRVEYLDDLQSIPRIVRARLKTKRTTPVSVS